YQHGMHTALHTLVTPSLLIAILFLFAASAHGQASSTEPAVRDFPVTDFGAAAGGKQLATGAIQSAIDHAQSAGGGRVVIPKGVFRSGSIFIKPGVSLHLAEGAVLLGSDNIEDYPK